MSKTNYLENAILDHVLKGTAMTQPANIYISLHTDNPGESGVLTYEISGFGYQRKLANSWLAASGGIKKNSGAITFDPASSGNWGLISHFGIHDAQSGGNMLYYGQLLVAKNIYDGDALEIPDQSLTITED